MHVLLLIGTSLSPLRYPPELDTYLKGFHGDNCATVGVGTIDADGQRLMDATEVRHKTQVLRTMSARAVLPPFRSESSHARLAFWRRHVAYFVKRGVFKSLLLVLGQQGGGGRRRAPGETNGKGVVEGGGLGSCRRGGVCSSQAEQAFILLANTKKRFSLLVW